MRPTDDTVTVAVLVSIQKTLLMSASQHRNYEKLPQKIQE